MAAGIELSGDRTYSLSISTELETSFDTAFKMFLNKIELVFSCFPVKKVILLVI